MLGGDSDSPDICVTCKNVGSIRGLESWQVCDDGNTNNNDGCTNSCKVQAGYVCNRRYNSFDSCKKVVCGNKVIESPVEECDDGN